MSCSEATKTNDTIAKITLQSTPEQVLQELDRLYYKAEAQDMSKRTLAYTSVMRTLEDLRTVCRAEIKNNSSGFKYYTCYKAAIKMVKVMASSESGINDEKINEPLTCDQCATAMSNYDKLEASRCNECDCLDFDHGCMYCGDNLYKGYIVRDGEDRWFGACDCHWEELARFFKTDREGLTYVGKETDVKGLCQCHG